MYKKGTILVRDMSSQTGNKEEDKEEETLGEKKSTSISHSSSSSSAATNTATTINARERAQAKDQPYRDLTKRQKQRDAKRRRKAEILRLHVDLIRDEFWEKYPFVLDY